MSISGWSHLASISTTRSQDSPFPSLTWPSHPWRWKRASCGMTCLYVSYVSYLKKEKHMLMQGASLWTQFDTTSWHPCTTKWWYRLVLLLNKDYMFKSREWAREKAERDMSLFYWLHDSVQLHCKRCFIGWLWLRGRASILLSEGSWFYSPGLHVEVSLGKILRPKLLLMC